MPRIVKVAEKRDIPEGEGRSVTVGDNRIAVFNVGGVFYATIDECPHAGGPLSEGWLDDSQVTCPWHGWTFDLNAEGGEAYDGLKRYKVRLDGDAILVELPD